MGKYCNYPLTTTLGDRFASCENTVSRSQTLSLHPPDFKNCLLAHAHKIFATARMLAFLSVLLEIL